MCETTPPNEPPTQENRFALVLLLVATFATILPFWCVTFPPSADLPQHLAQLHLVDEVLAGQRPDLALARWNYPNTLVYWPMYGLWKLVPPLIAGKLTLSLLAATWVSATWLLCRHRRRPLINWLIGIPLAFNALFIWGLLNFLIGWPIFCLLVIVATGHSRYRGPQLCLLSVLLYFAHALWFGVATLWLIVHCLKLKPRNRWQAAVALTPAWAMALAWYPDLAASRRADGIGTAAIWNFLPQERIGFDYFSNAALGAIHSELEWLVTAILLGWVMLVLANRRGDLGENTDASLLAGAIILGAGYFFLPNLYLNTLLFNERWLPMALSLLLLALPSPSTKPSLLFTVGATMLATLTMQTIASWRDWENEQMAGFNEAILAISPGDRVLGLNFLDGSPHVKGRPGLQLFAYAQAIRGAGVHFSFTEHHSGAVRFIAPPESNPARPLVWTPARVRREHLTGFNRVLINADESTDALFATRLGLGRPIQAHGTWRVYGIEDADMTSPLGSKRERADRTD